MSPCAAVQQDWKQRIEKELTGNILPFWIRHAVDEVNGGFCGALTNDLQVLNDVPRSAVLCARIVWTYSAAYRELGDESYLKMAQRAYRYLAQSFWDEEYGGVYWALDYKGRPVDDRKHNYAQAFAIYGLSEYYRATGEAESLKLAQELFGLVEAHTHDAVNGGNIEGSRRDWGAVEDLRLSDGELNSRKSMNTSLHLMEAYTNLLRVWDDAEVKAKQKGLIQVFLQHIVDPRTHHLRLFFDDEWHSLSEGVSFGHDIEASWLLVEAAELLGELALLAQARQMGIEMAEAVCAEGLDADGSLVYEATPHGVKGDKHWWVQAEAMVGFYSAYQASSQERFAEAAYRCWKYIEDKFVDRVHGEWFRLLTREGVPRADRYKVGPWECPYHQSRACFEILTRLGRQ